MSDGEGGLGGLDLFEDESDGGWLDGAESAAPPWAAVVAFVGVIAAQIAECDCIAVANEKSANDGNGVRAPSKQPPAHALHRAV